MRTKRILIAAAMMAALGACKKAEKHEAPAQKPGSGTGTGTGTGTGSGTGTGTGTAVDAAADGKVKAFFYTVEKDGKVSHLLGTMHIGVAPDRLPDAVYTELAKAKTFAMETDLSDTSILGDLMLPEGKSLDTELGPEYWKKLQDAIGAQMANGLKRFKPSTAASLLELQGLPMTDPMDMVLLGKAKETGATIVYLEKAALQEQVLDKWLDVRGLKEMLDEQDTAAAKSKEMLDAYVTGDEDTVAKLTADRSTWKRSPEEFDAMMKDLLYDRNASWIPELEKILGQGDTFVAVGAAHLIGDGSVVDLLRKKGFTITRVGS